jgi:small glutamine-rich tetratricopeptide repeat-containing protein alpha
MADMLRGMGGGGGGGGGGMPDLSSILNNPQMMAMAQQMAANGGLERLMSNPAVANMVSSSHDCLIYDTF